jgi:hypothetical protein
VKDAHKTLPWAPEEYLRVGGRQLVYTVNRRTKEIDVVRLPGGAAVPIEHVLSAGRPVVWPRILRTHDYTREELHP